MSETTQTPPRRSIAALFLDHPSSVDETYFQHMRFALGFAGNLFIAAGAALIHAVLPFACEKTASNRIRAMYARIENRGK